MLTKISSQLRVSFGGVYGYDLTAVYKTAEIMRIPLTPGLVDKLSDVEFYYVKKLNQEKGEGTNG